jgi:hypothetical protein
MPYALPADAGDFTGRRAAVAELTAALTPGVSMPVAAVSGMGGVGKTALAVHVAHALGGHYPGGRLYADLRGLDGRPTEPYDLLGGLLRALGRTDVPDGPEERAALYRSDLAARRVLILLDGARDRAQIRPLLPGAPGSAVLVTSRVTMAGLPGVRLMELDVLEPDEAITLLTRITGRDRIAASRGAALDLVTACGLLPAAVREAAELLTVRPWLGVGELARGIAADPLRELPAVRARLRRGHHGLRTEEARAFRLLAPSAGAGLTADAAAAALRLHPDHADDLLDALADQSLLECVAPGRYRCHALLRSMAAWSAGECEPAAGRAGALRGLVNHHLAAARAARSRLDLNPPQDGESRPGVPRTTREARTWVFTEHSAVLSAIGNATHDTDGPLAAATELLLAMTGFLDDGWNPATLEHVALAGHAAARTRGMTGSQVRAAYVVGHARWWWRREPDTAAVPLRAAVHLGWRYADPLPAALALDTLTLMALATGGIADAAALGAQAEEAWRAVGDPSLEAVEHVARARLQLRHGTPAAAVASCHLAAERSSDAGDVNAASHALYHHGIALRAAGRPEESLARLSEGLVYGLAAGARLREAHTLFRMAESFLDLGRAREAAHHTEHALALLDSDAGRERGAALAVLGRALDMMGDHTAARARLVQACELLAGEDGLALRQIRSRPTWPGGTGTGG